MLQVNDNVVILRGEHRGWVGRIVEVVQCNVLKDYKVLFEDMDDPNGSMTIQVPSEDCRLYIQGAVQLTSDVVDFSQYLTVDEMKDILKKVCERIYEDKVRKSMNDAKNNWYTNFVGRIQNGIIERYVSETFDEYHDQVIDRIRKLIDDENTRYSSEDHEYILPFSAKLLETLYSIAWKYCDEHPDEITALMKDKIHEVASNLAVEKVQNYVGSKIMLTSKEIIERLLPKDEEQ